MRIHFVLAGLVLCSGRELAAQQPSQPVAAESRKSISVACRFLTLGLGGEVARLLTDHVAARVGANYFKLSTTKTQSDITYDVAEAARRVGADRSLPGPARQLPLHGRHLDQSAH